MKKIIFGIMLLFTCGFGFSFELSKYNEVDVLKYNSKKAQEFKDYEGGDAFFPYGWSKDGKFAYITTYDGGVSSIHSFTYIIQDMVTDEIIYEDEIRDSSVYEKYYDEYYNFEPIKKEAESKYNSALKRYGIIESRPEFLNPDAIKGLSFDVKVLKKGSMFGDDKISKYSITASKQGVGSKTLGTFSRNENHVNDVFIGGIIKSPYENRIAVLIVEDIRFLIDAEAFAWHLAGCHTNIGF